MHLNLFVGLAAVGFACVVPNSHAQTTVRYLHTDAMGSIVAVSDESGNVVERREYEPYGAQLTPALQDGPGFTGHVQDAATGLTYMQQRYYDPLCGCFLSVDPVTAYDNGDMRFFNRYAYAFNNPYSFTDPDGRCPNCTLNPREIARMAPAARMQTAQRQAQAAMREQVGAAAQQVAQDFDDGRGTLQVGVAVNGQLGPMAVTVQAGVAIDRQGNVAVYSESGGGLAQGAQVAAGVTAQITNAESVGDLAGTAVNVSAGGGKAAYGSVDGMTTTARDGSAVYGVGGTVGAGVGGGGAAVGTSTNVVPVIQRKEEIR